MLMIGSCAYAQKEYRQIREQLKNKKDGLTDWFWVAYAKSVRFELFFVKFVRTGAGNGHGIYGLECKSVVVLVEFS